MKNSLLVGGAVISVGAASIASVGIAAAATNNTDTSGQSSIVDKLVTKFGLNKADVQKVFDEEKTTRDAERQQKTADKLAELVKDGKLTQEQADKLTAKAKELQTTRQANRDAMKDKTDEERKATMDKERDAIKTWLSDNKIDEKYARFIFGGGHGHGGPGRPEGRHGSMDSPESNN